MNGGVVTELDRRIAAAVKATAGETGLSGDRIIRLIGTHQALKVQLAAGLVTDAEYAKEAGGLLNVLGNSDGLIAEASPRA